MRIRLPIILTLLALLTALLVPSVAYAKDPVGFEKGMSLLEETSDYRVYFNSETKGYKFEDNTFWAWEKPGAIPNKYQPSDPQIISILESRGINKNKVHIHRGYSAQYPTAITYREYGTDNYVMLTTGLPQVTSTGELIDCKWNKTIGNVYIGGANWFEAVVNGTRISVTSEIGNVTWDPQLFLNDVEQYPSKATILAVDPTNENYSYNVLEWDYGVAKRRVRLIEGSLFERWIVSSSPYGEIRIEHNSFGDLSLGLSGAWDAEGNSLGRVVGDEEIVTADGFNRAVYPVTIGAVLTVFSTSSDGWAGIGLTTDTWANVRAGNGTAHRDNLASDWSGLGTKAAGDFECNRGFFPFDVSAASGGIVSAGTFSLYYDTINEADADGADLALVEGVQQDPIVNSDYEAHYTKTTEGSDTRMLHPQSLIAYTDLTLNATGIGWVQAAIVGAVNAKFCTRVACDIDGVPEPTGANGGTVFQNEDGAGKQPKLVITYTTPPTVTSSAADPVGETSATLKGNITSTGVDPTCDERGFVYGTSAIAPCPGAGDAPPAGYDSSWADAGGPWGVGVFDSGANISGLTEGELYYWRAYAHNSDGYDYSDPELKFLTKPVEPTNLAVVVGGSGQLNLTWNTGAGFDTTYIRRLVGAYPALGTGDLVYNAAGVSYNDTGLTGGLDYYYRAWSYCTEGGLEQYSDLTSDAHEIALTAPVTACEIPVDLSPPVLTQMYCSANVTSLGSLAPYDERGFVWGTISVPANPDDTAISATAYEFYWSETGTWAVTGDYNHTPTLVEGTTYYIRSGAHNASYWGYSSEVSFSTFDQVLWYEPNTMIIAVALPDLEGTQDGVIVWGSNTGISVILGSMESSEAVVATPDVTGGFDMPESILPETWFASGSNIPNLPLYDGFNAAAIQMGMPVQTLYFIGIIGLAFALMLFVVVFTRSALLGVLAMTIVLFVGSSQTIIPMWIPAVVLIVDFGIMFLYRQVSY